MICQSLSETKTMECLMNTDTKIFDDMFDVASALKDVNGTIFEIPLSPQKIQ